MSTINDAKVLNAILNPNTPFEEDILKKNESKYDETSKEIIEAKGLEVEVGLTEEALLENHKKEKKALSGKIQALKKSVTKGDKKKKKEIDAQIDKLEKDFTDKCNLELTQLKTQTPIDKVEETKSIPTKPITDQIEEKSKKMSKAQKRREKKDQENEERDKLIALQEIENLKGPTHIELTRIKEKLKKIGLEMKEVSADGNCMFYAISDQLNQKLSMLKTIEELRQLTSSYMLKNSAEFQPYMCSEETGDPLSPVEYEEYCVKLLDCMAPVWGSMTELKALCDVLKVPIQVIQAEGSEILIGDSGSNVRLVITYHRRMFGAGEHYNSTCSLKANDEF